MSHKVTHNSFQPRKIEDFIEDFDFELDAKIKAEEDLIKLRNKANELEKELEKLRQEEIESKRHALTVASTLREMGLSEHTIVSAVLADLKSRYKKTNRPTIFSVEDKDLVNFIRSRQEDGVSFKEISETFFDVSRRELSEMLKHLLSNGSIWVKGKTRSLRYLAAP